MSHAESGRVENCDIWRAKFTLIYRHWLTRPLYEGAEADNAKTAIQNECSIDRGHPCHRHQRAIVLVDSEAGSRAWCGENRGPRYISIFFLGPHYPKKCVAQGS